MPLDWLREAYERAEELSLNNQDIIVMLLHLRKLKQQLQ